MRPWIASALLSLILCPACDFSFSLSVSSDGRFPPASAEVAGDPATDGSVGGNGVVASASVIRCGFDPFGAVSPQEHRGFLSFPLAGIPPGAFIESATVTFHVDRVDLASGSPDLLLALDHVHYGQPLASGAFSAAGVPVRGFLPGVRLVPAQRVQRVSVAVVPELQADVDDPFLRFFQLRATCAGGLAQIVDGAGNRAGGAPGDVSLIPVLSVRYRS